MQDIGGKVKDLNARANMSGNPDNLAVSGIGVKGIIQTSGDFVVPSNGLYEIAVQGAQGASYNIDATSQPAIAVHQARFKKDQVIPCVIGAGGIGNTAPYKAGDTYATMPDGIVLLCTGSANDGGANGVASGGNIFNGVTEYGPYVRGLPHLGNGYLTGGQCPGGMGRASGLTGSGNGGGGRVMFTRIA